MGDVAPLEVVADARAADAVDALPVALPRAAQYTGFASMHWGSGRRVLNEERRAPSATTAERKLNTLSFRELCGGSPGNGRLGAPTSLKTRQQPKKPRALSEINWYIATIKPSPTRLITTSTTTMQALMRGRAGSTRRGSKMAYVCRKKKPPYSNCETSRSTSGARKIATRRLLVRIETSWTSARR